MDETLIPPYEYIIKKDFPGKEENKNAFREEDQDYLLAASSTDCTGLMPAAPKTEQEVESYEQIQHFLPPSYQKNSKDKEDDKTMKIWN